MEEARGTLFFNILHILREKRPAAYFLENVRGLANHMSGDVRTITIIEEKLREIGYSFELFHVKASDFNVPQHRPRVFIIGFRDTEAAARFQKPQKVALIRSLKDADILGPTAHRDVAYTLRVGGRGSGVNDRRNWDCYRVGDGVVRIEKEHGIKIQGFPDWFSFPDSVANSQAMKQLGNSVAVPAIEAYARAISEAIRGSASESEKK
jgi:DNA (cytosine-5)-methyltransferase 1